MNDRKQYCTFVLDGDLFGIEVDSVREIVRHQEMTRIPHAPKAVAGLINLRGEIVPAIELRRCLELPDRDDEVLPTNVVVRSDDGAVSFLVDEIGDVLEIGDDAYEPTPDNLKGAVRDLIQGVFKLGEGLLMVLSPEMAIRTATDLVADA